MVSVKITVITDKAADGTAIATTTITPDSSDNKAKDLNNIRVNLKDSANFTVSLTYNKSTGYVTMITIK